MSIQLCPKDDCKCCEVKDSATGYDSYHTYSGEGRHPLLVQRNAVVNKIKALREEYKLVDNQLRTAEQEARKFFMKEYTYSVVVGVSDSRGLMWYSLPTGTECVRITRKPTEAMKASYDTHLQMFCTAPSLCENDRSPSYYRNENNVVLSEGGGSMLLKEGLIMNDEQWNQLKAGNIDKSWIRPCWN